ncbi:bifunctional 2',3'-cyclic-nucleotide 2'-phosphodiesterase/3'-nucleotidase [Primorskyibacter sp. 2E107]|uniref:bifunctional 2',3'-cyclic-nucleotide 2'-phosphodiesterase/3'-nucleotidase n=1 Tax=Primorskyibacter sp. 2E107 TaxID=3403458 RepID=UPI003AF65279
MVTDPTSKPMNGPAPITSIRRSPPAGRDSFILRILATTDLHAHLTGYDYDHDRMVPARGLSVAASMIRRARAEADACVLLDNGDLLQGNALGDLIGEAAQADRPRPHPVIAAMNALGYDAATPGNHDFNFGTDFLRQAIADADFPFVLGNIAVSGRAEDALCPRFVILDRSLTDSTGAHHALRVGVIGLTPPQSVIWDHALLNGGLTATGFVEAATALIPAVRAAGADIVVLLAHTGLATQCCDHPEENAGDALSRLDGVDALVIGHQHRVFPAPDYADHPGADVARGLLNGCPAVMPGAYGEHLGVIDLQLEKDSQGWHVVSGKAEARPASRRGQDGSITPLAPEDPAIAALAAPTHLATLDRTRQPIGHSAVPLHSHFALIGGPSCLNLIAEAKRAFVARHLAGTEAQSIPVLSTARPVKWGGQGDPDFFTDIPAGPLSLRNVTDMYPYQNEIRAVMMTGAGIREWLERTAGQFNQITPGQTDTALIDASVPSYQFDLIFGISYRFDITQPKRYDAAGRLIRPGASRVRDLRYKGTPVAPDQRFVVATNSFRSDGGGNVEVVARSQPVLKDRKLIRGVLSDHIRAAGVVAPEPAVPWSFYPIPGTTAHFRTGRNARPEDLPASLHTRIQDIGRDADGFRRFRLSLDAPQAVNDAAPILSQSARSGRA